MKPFNYKDKNIRVLRGWINALDMVKAETGAEDKEVFFDWFNHPLVQETLAPMDIMRRKSLKPYKRVGSSIYLPRQIAICFAHYLSDELRKIVRYKYQKGGPDSPIRYDIPQSD